MSITEPDLSLFQPGQLIARGVSRLLLSHDFAVLEEFVPTRGLRVDVMGVGPKGELWVVECKSSRADYMSDSKWQGYLEFCDRFFWAVGPDFPVELLPEESGLIIADAWGGEIVRMPSEVKLAGARRKMLMQKIARDGLRRLQGYRDPQITSGLL
ncbi:MmcB family DNA repair protein [Pseudooceanicola sp. C21-150M6]|uniref:MmcB family DNA repair protein n=1 Tax=Pseudooceanicola sp. C21-150M6 TaxID=3434355 RepID=UPI003D7F1CF9